MASLAYPIALLLVICGAGYFAYTRNNDGWGVYGTILIACVIGFGAAGNALAWIVYICAKWWKKRK